MDRPLEAPRRSRPRPTVLRPSPGRVLILVAAVLLAGGCDPGSPGEARVSREAFVAVYVDLRRAALLAPEARIEEDRRQAILEAHGVSEEDLLQFVDAHGRDTETMASIWAEVERLLAADRARADSAG